MFTGIKSNEGKRYDNDQKFSTPRTTFTKTASPKDELQNRLSQRRSLKKSDLEDSPLKPLDTSPDSKIDEYLRSLFENRLTSMMGLRVKMEDLTSLQKKEEAMYVKTIKDILKRNAQERDKYRQRENLLLLRIDELEEQLKKEMNAKMEIEEKYKTFKSKGNEIIGNLRKSLTAITKKYKELRAQNEKMEMEILTLRSGKSPDYISMEKRMLALQQELNNAKEKINSMRKDGESAHWDALEIIELRNKLLKERERRTKYEAVMESKIIEYKRLIEEEENVIAILKKKLIDANETIEMLTEELEMRKNTESDDIPNQYIELYNELKRLLEPEEGKILDSKEIVIDNPEAKIKAQHKLINILLMRLQTEEKSRLKTEEQAAEVLSQEEKTIAFLEKKIAELEKIIHQQKDEAELRNSKILELNEGSLNLEYVILNYSFTTFSSDNYLNLSIDDLEKQMKQVTLDLNTTIEDLKSKKTFIPEIEQIKYIKEVKLAEKQTSTEDLIQTDTNIEKIKNEEKEVVPAEKEEDVKETEEPPSKDVEIQTPTKIETDVKVNTESNAESQDKVEIKEELKESTEIKEELKEEIKEEIKEESKPMKEESKPIPDKPIEEAPASNDVNVS